MFERFGEARRITLLAQDEARLLGHTMVTSEHLVLALLHDHEGAAAAALHLLGINLEGARSMVVEVSGRGSMVASGRLPFTASSRTALEFGLQEALQLGGGPVRPEHVLLALLRQPDSRGTRLLTMLGAEPRAIRAELLRRMHGESPARDGDSPDGDRGSPDMHRGSPGVYSEATGGRGDGWVSEVGRVLPPLFTSSARRVIDMGRLEARRLGQAHLGTEHLLLALASGADEATTRLLVSGGVTPEGVRGSLFPVAGEVLMGLSGDLPLTPKAKRVLSRSLARAEAHGERAVGARHLLFSLLGDDDGAVGLILSELGAPMASLREEAEALCRQAPRDGS